MVSTTSTQVAILISVERIIQRAAVKSDVFEDRRITYILSGSFWSLDIRVGRIHHVDSFSDHVTAYLEISNPFRFIRNFESADGSMKPLLGESATTLLGRRRSDFVVDE